MHAHTPNSEITVPNRLTAPFRSGGGADALQRMYELLKTAAPRLLPPTMSASGLRDRSRCCELHQQPEGR